jgi:ribose/xylose/arabinose/galactoside ABC-type transport system permease subunit
MRRFVRRSDLGIIIGCIFIFALFSLWNPQQWFNWGTISNIGQYTAILGLLAIGQTFVILIREIDLSVGSVYGIVGITFIGAAFIGYADGSFGATMELSAIAAAVLGGCHLTGGRISLIGTLFGAFMLRGIQSFLILLAVQPQWYILVVGLIVVLASLADRTLTSFALKK